MSTYLKPNDRNGSTFNPIDYNFEESFLTSNNANVLYAPLSTQQSLLAKTGHLQFTDNKTKISGELELGDNHNLVIDVTKIGVFNENPTRELDVTGSINASQDIYINNVSLSQELQDIKADVADNTNEILDNFFLVDKMSEEDSYVKISAPLKLYDGIQFLNTSDSYQGSIYTEEGTFPGMNFYSTHNNYFFSGVSTFASLYLGGKQGQSGRDEFTRNLIQTRSINQHTEMLLYEGSTENDRIRLKSGQINFDIHDTSNSGDNAYNLTSKMIIQNDKTNLYNDLYVDNNQLIVEKTGDAMDSIETSGDNGVVVTAGPDNNNKSVWMGLDATRNIGYVNAAEGGVFMPLCLQTRGSFVGIGTTEPEETLHVAGTIKCDDLIVNNKVTIENNISTFNVPIAINDVSSLSNSNHSWSGYILASSSTHHGMGSNNFGLRSANYISAQAFTAVSSKKIKSVESSLDEETTNEAIDLFKSIPLSKYTYKDKKRHDSFSYYGLIAEDIPNGLYNFDSEDFVPNIYQMGNIEPIDGNTYSISFANPIDLTKIEEHDFLKILYKKNSDDLIELISEDFNFVDENTIRLKIKDFDGELNQVFVYGTRETIPTVKKEAYFELTSCVVKNLLERIEILEQKINELENK